MTRYLVAIVLLLAACGPTKAQIACNGDGGKWKSDSETSWGHTLDVATGKMVYGPTTRITYYCEYPR